METCTSGAIFSPVVSSERHLCHLPHMGVVSLMKSAETALDVGFKEYESATETSGHITIHSKGP